VGSEHVAYECPTGVTAIFKDLRLSCPGSPTPRAVVFVSSGPADVVLVDQAMGTGDVLGRDYWIVLEPGQEIRVYSVDEPFTYWMSGTELQGLAP